MPFNFGQRVRLNRKLEMSGFAVKKGAEGIVANVHLQTSVLFDGLDQELAVADSDLDTLGQATGTASASVNIASTANSNAAGFQVGQRVRLLVPKHLGGQTIPAGSFGTVTQDAPSMNASWVLFDGFPGDKLIPNSDLQSV